MTLQLYLWCIGMFLVGQAATMFLYHIPEAQKLAKKASYDFDWKEWWRKDRYAVTGIQLLGIIVFVVLDEILHFRPTIIEMIKGLFAIFGIIASGIAARFGGYQKMLLNIIDLKTNYAHQEAEKKIAKGQEIPDVMKTDTTNNNT